MPNGYSATLKGGQQIFIPKWSATTALLNLTKAGEYIGSSALVRISELNTAAAIVALTTTKNSDETIGLVKHFVCTARMDGDKIEDFDKVFEGRLALSIEVFCHVVKAVYADFFEQGLVEEVSQEV